MCTVPFLSLKSKEKETSVSELASRRMDGYLVGAADQLKDVDVWMRLSVVRQQGVQVGDGREGTVLVGHTVQVPGI